MPREERTPNRSGWTLTHTLLTIIVVLIATPLLICAGCFFFVANTIKDKAPSVELEPKQQPPQRQAGLNKEVVSNNIGITVTDIRFCYTVFKPSFGGNEENRRLLKVEILVMNRSDSRKIDFREYAGISSFTTDMRDNFGNRFRQATRDLAFRGPYDRSNSCRLDPGQGVSETLLFELPLKNSESLTLILDKSNVDAINDYKFIFPRSDWVPDDWQP